MKYNFPTIPTPESLAVERDAAKLTTGILLRVARIIKERPDLDVYRFTMEKEDRKEIVDTIRNAGWKVRETEDDIFVEWP
jgi:hypothetical protein